MQLSLLVKRNLYLFGILFLIVFVVFFQRTHKFSCDAWANDFMKVEKFSLILTEKKAQASPDVYLTGIDVINKAKIEYHDSSGWIARNIDKFNIGDTLTKDIGKYAILIKRKNQIISIPCDCDGKTYK